MAEWSLQMSVGEHSWLWQPAQGSKSEAVGSHPEAAPGGTRALVGQTQRAHGDLLGDTQAQLGAA